ncbi:AsnC family protein [Subtercola endophyticus]|uniref:AsnC family protein n=1 Tax=Subtercola endophyticus TaxID=2895559 RepID=UPI001E370845|nr:AsnC family protein [Subtercola endophyticus]UFS59458.1 AsnC family protein [Subtercola endophyticus]
MDINQSLRNLLGTISETLAPDDASTTTRLEHLTLIRTELDKLTKNEVEAARSFGESWESIGAALGTSKQSAWEKYK